MIISNGDIGDITDNNIHDRFITTYMIISNGDIGDITGL